MGLEEPYRWKDSVQSGDEIRLWVADGMAHDLRPWFTKFNAKPIDKRWLPVVEEIYNWHYTNEKYLRNEKSLARRGDGLFAADRGILWRRPRAAKVEDHALGFYQALVEARIPFEMVHDSLLDAEHIDRYRTLILPNIAALSDRAVPAAARIRANAAAALSPPTKPRFYDEWGVRRADFGLADSFGASFDGKIETQLHNSYLNIEKDPATADSSDPDGLENATRIINGVNWVHVHSPQPRDAANPADVVPSYPDLPMEEVFSARPAHRYAGRLCARGTARAASSISRSISTARSGKCSPRDHGRCCGMPSHGHTEASSR